MNPSAKSELTPSGKLRVGVNLGNFLLRLRLLLTCLFAELLEDVGLDSCKAQRLKHFVERCSLGLKNGLAMRGRQLSQFDLLLAANAG